MHGKVNQVFSCTFPYLIKLRKFEHAILCIWNIAFPKYLVFILKTFKSQDTHLFSQGFFNKNLGVQKSFQTIQAWQGYPLHGHHFLRSFDQPCIWKFITNSDNFFFDQQMVHLYFHLFIILILKTLN
jgi:hypothetical protein